jgi:hypothetical protein
MHSEQPAVEPAGPEADQAAACAATPAPESDPIDRPRVYFEAPAVSAEALLAKAQAIKELIAARVRQDSQQDAALSYQDTLVALDIDLRYGTFQVGELLAEMATDPLYPDIRAITSATGMLFAYSTDHLPQDQALAKSVIEEAKHLLSSAIRADSRDSIRLTPVQELYAMAPDTDAAIIDVLLKGMPAEPRYADILKATAADGGVYYHSDTYLTASYATTLMLALAGDFVATMAETIREESRIYPRTTNLAIFRDQSVYGIPADEVDTAVYRLLLRPQYADIRRIVHPVTRAVHLYSQDYLRDDSAWAMMDWEEVGRANNP